MPKNGLFITFEGVEGAGKTTQILRLASALRERGHDVLTTREPGGHPVGEEIRRLLLNNEPSPTPRAELLLFLAARAQLTEDVIRPHLEAGGVALCDRYIDSTVAYQGYARAGRIVGHASGPTQDDWVARVRELNDVATAGLKPDLTLLLDVNPAVGLARQKDHNRMEAEDLEFHQRVRHGFLTEAEREPARFRVIDASQPPDQTFAAILSAVEQLVQRITKIDSSPGPASLSDPGTHPCSE
jgi:dTMP kinase